ncbi:MAG: OsmC family protein [Kiloniellales bacterium]
MAELFWEMSERTIVRKREARHEQESLPDPHLVKVKQGERVRIDIHANVTFMPEGQHLKQVEISSNMPDAGNWTLISDEGTAVGGRATAPAPLMYFAAGLGLCLMTHVEMLAKARNFQIDKARLEQRCSFSRTLDIGGLDPALVYGKGEEMQVNLLLESPETPERLAEFLGWCRQSCMALQSLAGATAIRTTLFINDEEIGDVGGLGPHEG